jgi:hypothetical protein
MTDRYHNLKHKTAAIFNRHGLVGVTVQVKHQKDTEEE